VFVAVVREVCEYYYWKTCLPCAKL